MAKITVLGLGKMGSRMAENLLKAGHHVTVWNRTKTVDAPVIEAGAKLAETPKLASRNAEFVIAMVRDNEASRHVWLGPEGALSGMSSDAIAIESSTLTPAWINQLGTHASNCGISFLEAPVSGSTPQAEAAQLVYLVGGEAEILTRAKSILEVMGSSIIHVGPLGAGALSKLATNTLLGVQVTVLSELIGILQHSGADVASVLNAVAKTPVWSAVASRLVGSMLEKSFSPQFPIELIEKDFGYMLDTGNPAVENPTISAARHVFRIGMENELGSENMTAVVKLFTEDNVMI